MAIVSAVAVGIPDWKARFDFWVHAAGELGGHLDTVAAIISSPWFSPGLAGAGLLYVILARETAKPIHVGWRILGGAVFGAIALIMWSVLVAGYTILHLPPSQQAPNQHEITEDQRQRLLTSLDHVPSGQTYKVWFAVMDSGECRIYASEISDEWSAWGRSHGWNVGGYTNHALLLRGISLGDSSKQCPEAERALITNAFAAAQIPLEPTPSGELYDDSFGATVGVPAGNCYILVGFPG
ncbi:MAG: hypothetical protein ACHQZS_11330 [Candidatus Binatales bacterium]